ncbi:MAG: cation:proton antiporter [Chloroflexi bacterium]|nr:cation:proton antiporter [Chloroflexota bacterium]
MTQPFTPPSHHDILLLLVQVGVLLLAARVMGELAQRLGQPTVVGEILAGILIGPSVLSGIFPGVGEWLVPQTETQGYLLEVISLLGAMFMLLITGLETDIGLIRRQARTAIGVSIGGITVSFIGGTALGMIIPDDLLVDPAQRVVFALFVATALAISAIPVVAKVLMDLGVIRRTVGQTIIASGMIDDTVGWILLSVVAGLAAGEAFSPGSLALSVGEVVLFMGVMFTVGQWIARRAISFAQDNLIGRDRVLALMVVLMFAGGAFAQLLNIEAVLGAFVAGILLARIRTIPIEAVHTLEKIALSLFAPIFFAVAGLKVNAIRLLEPDLLVLTVLMIVVAIVGKIIGTYLGARYIGGRDHWTSLSFGAGLSARGAIGIIIATVGLSLDILTQDVFSMIVVMSIATSVVAPVMLRWVLGHLKPTADEEARARQEQLNPNSLLADVRRVLLPVRVREGSSPYSQIEARILEKLNARTKISVTLMTVTKPDGRSAAVSYLDKLALLFESEPVTKKVAVGDNVGGLILDEAQKDYNLMVLGAPEGLRSTEVLFTPIVDFLMRTSPCPTLLVRGSQVPEDWQPSRVLIATNGSTAARRAAEVGFALAAPDGEAVILQVVERTMNDFRFDATGEMLQRQQTNAGRAVDELRELGGLQGVLTSAEVVTSRSPDQAIVDHAKKLGVDLIVLGTSVSVGSERLYLGPRVERILANSPCPVLVVNS